MRYGAGAGFVQLTFVLFHCPLPVLVEYPVHTTHTDVPGKHIIAPGGWLGELVPPLPHETVPYGPKPASCNKSEA
jgi:hypothetical protein